MQFKIFYYHLAFGLCLLSSTVSGATTAADSLRHASLHATTDTARINTLNLLSREFNRTGQYSLADSVNGLVIQLATAHNYSPGLARAYNNSGNTHSNLGKYPESLRFYFKAMEIFEKIGDKQGIGNELGNIGTVYHRQQNFDTALAYYMRSLKIEEELGNKFVTANTLSNIGLIYNNKGRYKEGLEYSGRALTLSLELGDKSGAANDLNNIAIVYSILRKNDTALACCRQALRIEKETGDKQGQAESYINMGSMLLVQKKYDEALESAMVGLELARATGFLNQIKDADNTLSEIYTAKGDPAKAFEYYKAFVSTRDSIFSRENTAKIVRAEMTYEFNKRNALHQEELKRQRLFLYVVSIGLLLFMLLAGIIFRSLHLNRKKTGIISKQKEDVEKHQRLLEIKNKEILDSINSAKRLQEAILPPLSLVASYLPDSFIYYQPKDIVAGDFYWMEHSNDRILLAAADCTGHGVPGAMVSLVCLNALNRAVREFGLTEPGEVLDKVRELVLEAFEKSESDVHDGMDISLVCLDLKNRNLLWSGANNPFWYTRAGVLHEIRADKQSICKQDRYKPFSTHRIDLHAGDIFYLFTDGFPDQFGGPQGRKMMYKRFKETLLNLGSVAPEQRMAMLHAGFIGWKGALEQVDDVLVIGVQV